jgi:zinc protease
MEDLERMTLKDLQRWYERWYAPNNAALVVVGDVDPKEVVALAKKYFGPIPARAVEPPRPPIEPPQTDMRRAQLRVPAEVPYLLLGYHAPVLTGGEDREQYALAVAAGILSGGQSARFATRLVRGSEVAADVGAEYNPAGKYPPLFIIGGTPAAGQNLKALEVAVLKEIERLKGEPVSEDELQRVKAQVVADEVYERDSVFGQAMVIGTLETVGLDWRLEEEYVKRVRAVTAADVQAAVKKYLVPRNLTVVGLDPLPLDRGTARPPRTMEPSHGR